MSKRRINKQQSSRIEKIQQNYHQAKDYDQDSLADGLVISRFGKHAEIEDNQGKRIHCSIRPNLDTIVSGDRVIWQLEHGDHGVVVSLYPRASILARPTGSGISKPVAANITQLIIVIAPKPEIAWPLLDSYLIMADTLKIHASIVLNKTDIPCSDIQNELENTYKPLGYPILYVSTFKASGLDQLKSALNHQVSVFVGQSGVGKSSLIASILPHEDNIATQDISAGSELGQHTTSNSRYYHLPSGGALIDSPGVREFSLWQMDPTTLAQGYLEFKPLIPQCKFRNCLHKDTPHCAIISALEQGNISQKRYDNYLKLCAQLTKSKPRTYPK
jgi:ribosome biogenesis GTPase / thiamine phosphate phosphatase